MGSYTADHTEWMLNLLQLPTDGTHREKTKRLKKYMDGNPNVRLAYPWCKCPQQNPDHVHNHDDQSLAPPPQQQRNGQTIASSPSTVEDTPPPDDNIPEAGKPSSHPATPPSPARNLLRRIFSPPSSPPSPTARPHISAAAGSSTHPSSGTLSALQPPSPEGSTPRRGGKGSLSSAPPIETTRPAIHDPSVGASTSITHTPLAAISSEDPSPPAAPNERRGLRLSPQSHKARRTLFSRVPVLGESLRFNSGMKRFASRFRESSKSKGIERSSFEHTGSGKDVAVVPPHGATEVEDHRPGDLFGRHGLGGNGSGTSGRNGSEEDVVCYPFYEVEDAEPDEPEMAFFPRNRLWQTRPRPSRKGKEKEVVRFHPQDIEEHDENVSETGVLPRESQEEDDRIWEAMRQEISEDSRQPADFVYETPGEVLKMRRESGMAYEGSLIGREVSYEEPNQQIHRKQILV